mmetsp:Transcript_31203/g.91543  ORF Transcript_31203/g.91543 Transcript_31203/m.91543 type:complete len:245 (-) Transcript_31203:367-1101(-)
MDVVHGSEGAHLAAHDEAELPLPQHLAHLARAGGREAERLEARHEDVDEECADGGELQPEEVEEGGREDDVPRLAARVRVERRVSRLDDLEANLDERVVAVRRRHHVGQPVPLLNQLLGEHVLRVAVAVLLGQAPLVRDEAAARLEHAVDLAVDVGAVRQVAAGLDGVHVVEGVVREGELVEVSLDKLAARREAGLGAEAVATVDLVLVESHSGDRRASEAAEVAERAADATAAVEHAVARLDA